MSFSGLTLQLSLYGNAGLFWQNKIFCQNINNVVTRDYFYFKGWTSCQSLFFCLDFWSLIIVIIIIHYDY